MGLNRGKMVSFIEDNIIDRTDKESMVQSCINFALNKIDRDADFRDMQREATYLTTISDATIATTDVDDSTDIITVAIDIPTGTKVQFSTTDTLPTGLSTDTDYWVIRESASTIKVADSYLKAWQDTNVDLTDNGTGTHTITAYRERIPKPSNCKYIYDFRLIDGSMSRKLEPIPPNELDRYVPFAAQWDEARPTRYVVWKDWVQLWKIPDDTYVLKMRYYKYMSELDDDSDEPEIGDIDEVILNAAASIVWGLLGELEQSSMFEARYYRLLKECKKVERMHPDLVLKPNMASYSRSADERQIDPFDMGR